MAGSVDPDLDALLGDARAANPYRRDLKINRPKYAELREILEAFVRAKAANDHDCGLPWFLNHAMPKLNASRADRGEAPIPCDLSCTTLLKYARSLWPEVAAKAFPTRQTK
ncbi:MAG: hypothetical protein ACE5DS_09785 [Kiloniellaceae bacterium]